MKLTILSLILIVLILSCSPPKDPVDKLVIYMDNCLKILEKHKDNPLLAKTKLIKLNYGKEEVIRKLGDDLKRLNRNLSDEEKKVQTDKLSPIIERMLAIIDESPTLLLDPDIAKAFEPFDLGF